jgi:hypothetical protein
MRAARIGIGRRSLRFKAEWVDDYMTSRAPVEITR